MKGACLCGQVTVTVPGRPDYLNSCNCTFCTKLGALWGYYPRSAVAHEGEIRSYVRTDLAEPRITGDFCPICGSTTSWSPIADDAPDRMAVNMRLFDPQELAGIEVRYGNRRDHASVEPRHYWRAPTVFGADGVVA